MSTSPRNRAATFFDSYRRAFEARDVAGIVDHFAYPCHVTTEADEIRLSVAAGREEWLEQIEQLIGAYEVIGVGSAEILKMTSIELSSRVVLTSVRWRLRDGSAAELYDFHALYTLAEVDATLKIVAIAHDELPRLQQLLMRRR